jgi:hypothetical protein
MNSTVERVLIQWEITRLIGNSLTLALKKATLDLVGQYRPRPVVLNCFSGIEQCLIAILALADNRGIMAPRNAFD